MTVRELMNKLIEEAPDLESEVYFVERQEMDSIDLKVYIVDSFGSNDSIFIELIKRTTWFF